MTFKIFFLLEFISKRAERQLQGESVSISAFLLEPLNVALGVTGEFGRNGVCERLVVTEFGSSGVIIGIVELYSLDSLVLNGRRAGIVGWPGEIISGVE